MNSAFGGRSGRNLLLIEDDEITRMIFSRQLARAGHQVRTATDGLEALDMLRRVRSEAIVTDLWMPVMDGFEFIQTVRLKSEYNHIPIIAISRSADEEDSRRALKLGADCFLHKSVAVERVGPEIEALLVKARSA